VINYSHGVGVNANIGYSSTNLKYHLEKGKYHLVIMGTDRFYGYHTGKYEVKAKVTSANETFTNPNNDIPNASKVPLNTDVNGQLAVNDAKDFYRFDIPESGKVLLKVKSYMSWYCVRLYDAEGNQLGVLDENGVGATGFVEKHTVLSF
jgi:hypothetical protein